MRNNLKRTLALLLAVIMTICVIPFTALSADDSDAVTLLAADMAITLNNNGKSELVINEKLKKLLIYSIIFSTSQIFYIS